MITRKKYLIMKFLFVFSMTILNHLVKSKKVTNDECSLNYSTNCQHVDKYEKVIKWGWNCELEASKAMNSRRI